VREIVPSVRNELLCVALALAVPIVARAAAAQGPSRLDLGGDLAVGGEAERYLRILQLAKLSPQQPWSIRPAFAQSTAGFVSMGVDHPWKERWSARDSSRTASIRLLRPSAKLVYNSAFPFGDNRGPAWDGRGLTAEVQAGVSARWWRFRAQIAPVAFVAQNLAFPLAPNGLTDSGRFADARFPRKIDAPQRFGERAYRRIDAGQSTVSLDLPGASVGVSTAAQSWGPAQDYPLVLSPTSGGFLHAFVATRTPVNLWLFRLHARLIAGRLSQSEFSPVTSDPTDRWATALAVVAMPRGITGLELGVARFIQGPSASGVPTVRDLHRLVSGGLSHTGELNAESENQFASVFFRWAVPAAGVELYGELSREDFSLDFRRFLQYPDDLSAYVLGLQRVLSSSTSRVRVFRAEVVNAEASPSNRGERGGSEHRLTDPLPPYLHSTVLQGHTNRGLFLGSPEAYGGAAWRVGVDQYTVRGRWSVGLERTLRLDWLPGSTASIGDVHPDVLYGVRIEAVRFAGARDYTLSVVPAIDLNRNLVRGHDVSNVNAAFTIRGWP
jgi:hypothetical protein